MQIDREEATRIADAICAEYPIDGSSNAECWRDILRQRIIKHLLPPAKLEWEFESFSSTWRSSGLVINVSELGTFALYGAGRQDGPIIPLTLIALGFPSLAEAKAAAQAHSDGAAQ